MIVSNIDHNLLADAREGESKDGTTSSSEREKRSEEKTTRGREMANTRAMREKGSESIDHSSCQISHSKVQHISIGE